MLVNFNHENGNSFLFNLLNTSMILLVLFLLYKKKLTINLHKI